MVTFVCSYCDTTLKKKQAQKHAFGRCRPASFICIDCHVTFNGNDFIKHTSCLTEFQKHWGDYAKPKQQSQKQNGEQQQPQGQANSKLVSTIATKAKNPQESVEKGGQEANSGWRGWKNELKSLIKQSGNKVELSELQNNALKRYRSLSEDDLDDEQIKQIIKDKVSKLKKVKLVTYVTLQ